MYNYYVDEFRRNTANNHFFDLFKVKKIQFLFCKIFETILTKLENILSK